MIRPYAAILLDSYRETLASRVLWLLMLVIVVVLGVLACVSVVEVSSWQFARSDFPYPTTLVREMYDAPANSDRPAVRRVWERLEERTRDRFKRMVESEGAANHPGVHEQLQERLTESFNRLLQDRELYDEASWPASASRERARELVQQGVAELSDNDLAELNRRLLESAFEGLVTESRGSAYFAYFLHWEIPTVFASTQRDMERRVNSIIVKILMLFVGIGGVFAAILTTSSIIPKTFEEGSIDLLLSKPVTRPLLYLTKYLGGCIFILMNAGVFLVGLWMIAGIRTDVWNVGILKCVYVFLFIFAMYYSVSALIGVIWKNAIVCVVGVIVFWFFCLVIGQVRQTANLIWFEPRRIASVQVEGDRVWGTARNGAIKVWDRSARAWREILKASDQHEIAAVRLSGQMVGPVWDAAHRRWIAAPSPVQGLQAPRILWGEADSETRNVGADLPGTALALFQESADSWLLVCPNDVYRLTGNITVPPREQGPVRIFGKTIDLPIKLPSGPRVYERISSDTWPAASLGTAVAYDHASRRLAMYDDSKIYLSSVGEDGRLGEVVSARVEYDGLSRLAIGGSTLVLADDQGKVTVFDIPGLSVRQTLENVGETSVDRVSVDDQGERFAVEWRDYRIDLLNAQHGELTKFTLPGQGHLTAAAFMDNNELFTVDTRSNLSVYDLSKGRRVRRESPVRNGWETAYYYLLDPIYFVAPKPSELGIWTEYLVTGEKTMAPNISEALMGPTELDVWGPVWSCGAFTAVMLIVGSVYVWRKDF